MNRNVIRTWALAAGVGMFAAACSDVPATDPTAKAPEVAQPQFGTTGTPNKQDWKQCQNNKDYTFQCSWTTGNLNATHNAYTEGDMVPHVLRIPGIQNDQPFTVVMTYGFQKGGKTTHDFLGLWNRDQTGANPCVDGSFNSPQFCSSGTLINAKLLNSNSMAALSQAAVIAACGAGSNKDVDMAAAIADAGPANLIMQSINAAVNVTNITFSGCPASGDAEATLTMTITPTADGASSGEALLLIGSHVAKSAIWRNGGAGGVNGSPYHLGLVSVDGKSAGSMDLQMAAAAVVIPPELTIVKTPDGASVTAGSNISFSIVVSNVGGSDATGVTLNDPLPTGSGVLFTIASQPAGSPCSITGGQVLECNFGTIAAGASRTVTVTSPTTNASCGLYENTATFHSTNGGTGSDDGDVTVTGCTGGISVRKFHDLNADGVENGSDTGLQNWVIRAYQSGTLMGHATTGSDGNAVISGLAPGSYLVCEVLQSGWNQSAPAAGGDCSEIAGTGAKGHTVTVAANANAGPVSFGNYQNVSIRVRKYEDLNADGSRNGADAYIAWANNIHVFGTSAGATPDQHAQITTAADGVTFSVKPGTYSICESIPSGWSQSQPGSGVDCSAHSGAAGNGYSVTVASGDAEVAREFGNFRNASITVRKYHDLDAGGTKNGAEAYITWDGISVNGISGTVFSETKDITNAASGAVFSVAPGSYRICEAIASGWFQSQPAPSATVSCPAGKGYEVTVASNGSASFEFGNYQNGSIAVRKFHDMDQDGIENNDDVGLDDWEIRAYSGMTLSGFVLTSGGGDGTITGLAPGTYTLCELMESGWVQTAPGNLVSCAGISGALGANGHEVTVTSGQTTSVYAFGNFQPLNWKGETATGFGTSFPGSRNWFMYTTLAQLLGGTVDLIAGQHFDAGDITTVDNGATLSITITLHAGFRFAGSSNNVKVAVWSSVPNGNVNPGNWRDHRATVPQNVMVHTFTVPKNSFYGIHADVERLVP